MVNCLLRKKSPQHENISGPGRRGVHGHTTFPTLPSNLEKYVHVIGNFVFEFNLITFASRVHVLVFSNLIWNHLRADGRRAASVCFSNPKLACLTILNVTSKFQDFRFVWGFFANSTPAKQGSVSHPPKLHPLVWGSPGKVWKALCGTGSTSPTFGRAQNTWAIREQYVSNM